MENSNIQKEQKFLSLLQETLKQARGNGGRISRDEIEEIFASLSLEKSQLEQVEGYLKAHKIVVGTQAGDLDELPREEKDFLTSYMEMLSDIPELSDSVLEAVKISAMAGEHSAQKELSEQMMKAVVDIAHLYAGQRGQRGSGDRSQAPGASGEPAGGGRRARQEDHGQHGGSDLHDAG